MTDPRPSLGFIGLGLMGSRMASRLIDAGYDVSVYNRTRERTKQLASQGAAVASSPAELAASTDVLLMSLADNAAVSAVMTGTEGVLRGLRSGSVVVDLSTISPRVSQEMARHVQSAGGAMLDTPVSGSTPQAEQGTLNIMIGGDEETYRRCDEILAVLGKHRFYLGPNGMGLVMKLAVNTMLGLGAQGLAEAMALGRKSGLDKDRMLDTLSQMAVVSPSQKQKIENARSDDYTPAFPLEHMDKDFGLIAELAMDNHVFMPSTAAAHELTKAARSRELTEQDFSVVVQLVAQLSGLS
ncbi:MAG TPA: NAD(P)-dependent oxidoreductase [Chloroflexota bacterium]|nr:NAD(P)-dependent oxidoreductase [Chloroflexota bacterium]